MTKTAYVQIGSQGVGLDFQLRNLGAMISQGVDTLDNIKKEMKEFVKDDLLFCPHCLLAKGEKVNVKTVFCTERVSHFAHYSNESTCVKSSQQTERHINAIAWLQEFYKNKPDVESVSIDKIFVKSEVSGRRRKPDLLVTYKDGRQEGHEVQISSINPDLLTERTTDLQDAGLTPIWYLANNSDKAEHSIWRDQRRWLTENGFTFFKIDFDDEDIMLAPVPFTSLPSKPKPRTGSRTVDRCSQAYDDDEYDVNFRPSFEERQETVAAPTAVTPVVKVEQPKPEIKLDTFNPPKLFFVPGNGLPFLSTTKVLPNINGYLGLAVGDQVTVASRENFPPLSNCHNGVYLHLLCEVVDHPDFYYGAVGTVAGFSDHSVYSTTEHPAVVVKFLEGYRYCRFDWLTQRRVAA